MPKQYEPIIDLPNEIWKDIPNYEGLYSVSNYGRILSHPRECPIGRNVRMTKLRILKPRLCGSGSPNAKVYLCDGESQKSVSVAHIVLEAFVGEKPTEEYWILYEDRDSANCALSNLDWAHRDEILDLRDLPSGEAYWKKRTSDKRNRIFQQAPKNVSPH